jgi:uncharacterized delta-60 repeat protein
MKTSGITSRPALVAALVVTLMVAGQRPALADPGDLDGTFGTGGRVTTDIGGGFDIARSVLVQPNGKVVVAGQATTGATFETADFGVARYLDTGDPDLPFSGDGRNRTDFGLGDAAEAVARQGDGMLVVVGSSEVEGGGGRFAVVRYKTGGGLDAAFSGDGKVRTGFAGYSSSSASDVAIQEDGKIVVVGSGFLGTAHVRPGGGGGEDADILVARYKPNGSLDLTFGGGDGKVTTDFSGNVDGASAVLILPSGKILVVGRSQTATFDQRVVAVRYLSNGTRDDTFDGDGKVVVNLVDGEAEDAAGVAVRSDGKILIGAGAQNAVSGSSDFDLAVVMLEPDGDVHLPYGGGDGIVFADFGGVESPDEMVRQDDGKLVFAATRPFVSSASPQAMWIFRLTGGGAPDGAFGTGGRAEVEFTGGVGCFGVAIDGAGRIVAAGRVGVGSGADFAVARLEG